MLILNPDSGILGLERHCFQYLIPFLMGILRGVDVSIIAPINGQTMFRQGTQPLFYPIPAHCQSGWFDHAVSYYTILHNIMQYFLIWKVSPQFFCILSRQTSFLTLSFTQKMFFFENSIILLFGVSKFCVISFAVFDILFRLGWSLGECCMNLACFYTT